jgi:hypothetical protein
MHTSLSLRHWAFVLLVIGCWLPSTRGQTPPNEEPKPATLRFLFLDEKPGAYSLKSGQAQRQISSAPYAISAPITVVPKGRLDIYQTPSQPDPVTGKKEPVKIVSLTPPATLTSALVVVTPHAPTPESPVPPPPDITYFDTGTDKFPLGSIRVINLGRASLGTQFDKTPAFLLQPGETRIVQPNPDAKNRVVVKIAVSEGDSWKLLSNKIAVLKPGQRMTGVFVYSASGLLHTYTSEELAEFGKPKPGHFWLTYTDTP